MHDPSITAIIAPDGARFAVGFVLNPATQRWQPWISAISADGEIEIACVSSHADRAQAHLVAHSLIETLSNGYTTNLNAALAQSQVAGPPDPLPRATVEELIAAITLRSGKQGQ